VYSCAVPVGRDAAAMNSQTRSPTVSPSTPGPTASTTPAPSWFGVISGNGNPSPYVPPARAFQSVGLTPETTTRTRTSPAPGSGISRSTSSRTLLAPGFV